MSDAAGEQGVSRGFPGCAPLRDLHLSLYRDYVTHHEQLWPRSAATPCGGDTSQLAEGARRLVLSGFRDASRSAAFDVCGIAAEVVSRGESNWRAVLRALGRAAELLETYSLNAAFFPWRKEMRSLKTFTGPFVYYIQSAVPDHVARKVLESIGYHRESDTEYRLSEGVGFQRAMQAAFQLFLARLECEHLLEVLAERTCSECINFLQMRSSDPDVPGFRRVSPAEGPDISEGRPSALEEHQPLVDPGSSLKDDCELVADSPDVSEQRRRSPETLPPQAASQPYTFLRDDRSILEMQKNYPDLAIRQKLVFATHRGHLEVLANDTSGPQSTVLYDVEAPREAGGMGMQRGSMGDDLSVAQLSTQLDMLRIKERCGDGDLKYPIEAPAPLSPHRL